MSMKLIMENWRKLLTEEDGVLGKYVWPSANKSYRGLRSEIDTEVEEKLYRQLHSFFGTSSYFVQGGPPLDEEAIGVIKQILSSGEYADVFKQCQGNGLMLRGMQVSFDWIKERAPQALAALPESGDSLEWNGPVKADFPYHSDGKYGKISSWTPDFNSARRFATTWSADNPADSLPCIIQASCETGTFLDTEPFARYIGGVYAKDFGIKKLNPQGNREVEYLLFGDCQIIGMQLLGGKETLRKKGFDV